MSSVTWVSVLHILNSQHRAAFHIRLRPTLLESTFPTQIVFGNPNPCSESAGAGVSRVF
jgi:hypothetical protein